eukprot:TRINITY_DN47196_c0_g1_i1.p1 TRINITY_DN47196_c0_g1~~TRINITY_DN47196_c0_g1_i1.p1  ORF type:complete len:912 (+),score=214.01 TRINITY_DN47196_c0_g1_i1:132-2867(+)
MRLLVQFEGQPAAVRVSCADSFEHLLAAVQVHKHAHGRRRLVLRFGPAASDGADRADLTCATFDDLIPDRHILFCGFAAADAPLGPPPDGSHLGSETTRRPSESRQQRALLSPAPARADPVVEEACASLRRAGGRVDSQRAPQLLRSLGVDCQGEHELFEVLGPLVSPDGTVARADLAAVAHTFGPASPPRAARRSASQPPFAHSAATTGAGRPVSPWRVSPAGRSSSRGRAGSIPSQPLPSPHNPCTPRTCVNARDRLPLGASAVSPMPAGRCIADLLGGYLSEHTKSSRRDSSSRSASGDSGGGRGRSGRGRHTEGGSSTTGSPSAASLRTVGEAQDVWPGFRPCVGGTPPPRCPPSPTQSHLDMLGGPQSAAGVAVCTAALATLDCAPGASVGADELPLLLDCLRVRWTPDSISQALSAARARDELGRRELALVLSRLQSAPPDQAIGRAAEMLQRLLPRGSAAAADTTARATASTTPGRQQQAGIRRPRPRRAGACPGPVERAGWRPTAPRGGSGDSAGSDPQQDGPRRRPPPMPTLSCPCCGAVVTGAARAVCGGCRLASYCSPECQEADWVGHHPICDTLALHRGKCKVNVLVHHQGVRFHVQACPSTARLKQAAKAASGTPRESAPGAPAAQYLLIVSQRVPVIRAVFIVLATAAGVCEFSYPAPVNGHGGARDEAAVHALLASIFSAVFEEAIYLKIWTLAACCLGPLRAYRCQAADFQALVGIYRKYFSAFLVQACSMCRCEGPLQYDLTVPPLAALGEVCESLALQQGAAPAEARAKRKPPNADPTALSEAKGFYLQLISYLQETDFPSSELQQRARRDRHAAMRRLSVVYQHIAAAEGARGRRMSHLSQSEAVLLRLVDDDPSEANTELLALLYDSLSQDPHYRQLAANIRRRSRAGPEH